MLDIFSKITITCDPGPCSPNIVIADIAAIIIGLLSTYFIVFYVLYIIACWRIFEKAGEKSWKALIPFYNMYITYKIVGMKNWFWGMIILSIVVSIITAIDGAVGLTSIREVDPNTFDFQAHIVSFITLLINFCINVYVVCVYSWRTSKIFGHGLGWTVGLILVPNIFWLMIAFGESKYNKRLLKQFTHKK